MNWFVVLLKKKTHEIFNCCFLTRRVLIKGVTWYSLPIICKFSRQGYTIDYSINCLHIIKDARMMPEKSNLKGPGFREQWFWNDLVLRIAHNVKYMRHFIVVQNFKNIIYPPWMAWSPAIIYSFQHKFFSSSELKSRKLWFSRARACFL